jgi:hypothetical protein
MKTAENRNGWKDMNFFQLRLAQKGSGSYVHATKNGRLDASLDRYY